MIRPVLPKGRIMARSSCRVRLDGVSHRFGDTVAVSGVDLDVGAGELVALLGPSGCGKSTLLRIVSGFIRQTAGGVLFDDEVVDGLRPAARGVGIVFQNYALFPHMTVAGNVAYGLQAHGWPRAKVRPRVEEMLARMHMSAAPATGAVRRPAAARRARPLSRHRPQGAAPRRAVRGARQEPAARHAD
jgi:ABC-type Fe3+/spermidine/putrescine transport system ATPase subunit